MIEILLILLTLAIFGKIFVFALKAAWSISTIVFGVVLVPICLIGLILFGLFKIAVPILAIVGLLSLIKSRD